jgi:hypothetical protein
MLKTHKQGAGPAGHKFGIKNIKESPITSSLGVIIIVAAIYSVLNKENITWMDVTVAIAIGILLVLAPDALIKKLTTLIK